jgi:hypothetical protein
MSFLNDDVVWGLGYGLATYSHKNYILRSYDEQEG